MKLVNSGRVWTLKSAGQETGPVIYWMSRDQRVNDNWALLYAQELAIVAEQPLIILFCLAPEFLGATVRQYGFMLRGLEEVEHNLRRLDIPLVVLAGDPPETLSSFVRKQQASAVVTDFSPLKIRRAWKSKLIDLVDIPVYEVDAHNIVPCREASPKQEYAAHTIRPKISKLLPEYLDEIPPPKIHPFPCRTDFPEVDWISLRKSLRVNDTVGEVNWLKPGESAARHVLERFINGMATYDNQRNDPTKDAQSDLSPYLHFGQISAQRVALQVQQRGEDIKSREAFLEQLIIRRELADNFCFYNDNYDSFDGFPDWSQKTLYEHRFDPRPYIYSPDQFELAQTHDELWNAAQMQMVISGKMHGYMRMYWAKKILGWSPTPEAALSTAIFLNDKYELDGRDSNGYTGIAWSIGGVHDRPWFERDVFGKIRYMSYDGCKRKFDVAGYINRIEQLQKEARV